MLGNNRLVVIAAVIALMLAIMVYFVMQPTAVRVDAVVDVTPPATNDDDPVASLLPTDMDGVWTVTVHGPDDQQVADSPVACYTIQGGTDGNHSDDDDGAVVFQRSPLTYMASTVRAVIVGVPNADTRIFGPLDPTMSPNTIRWTRRATPCDTQ
jgi:hypothetical protein